jgi:hypothetical protein
LKQPTGDESLGIHDFLETASLLNPRQVGKVKLLGLCYRDTPGAGYEEIMVVVGGSILTFRPRSKNLFAPPKLHPVRKTATQIEW